MKSHGVRLVLIALIALIASALAPAPALAHEGTGLAGGFVSGFRHPLVGLDHLLAMVSVGIWGAFLGRPLVIALPVLFPGAMVAGAGVAMAGIPFPLVEYGIALSVVTLGLMILFAVRAPVVVACVVVALFALCHGHAHGTELPAAADPIGYSMGFVLCTGLLHVAGIALGLLKLVPNGVMALRAGGGLIACIGLWFLNSATLA